MKPFALLIVGVVVGWAASGVDWSRDVLAQDALIDAPPSTLQQDVPDAPPPATYRAVLDNPPKADGNLDPSIQRPRLVYETRMTVDAKGARHTEVMSRLVNADGSIVPEPTPPAANLVGRFQATAYGSPNGHGCYVVDTMTGKTWHVANGQQPHVVTEALSPQSTQSVTPGPARYGEPSLYVQPQVPEPDTTN